jgi:hypothetical protein
MRIVNAFGVMGARGIEADQAALASRSALPASKYIGVE